MFVQIEQNREKITENIDNTVVSTQYSFSLTALIAVWKFGYGQVLEPGKNGGIFSKSS